ncbi:DHA2 family efflux MFS transporter permease subunit [Mucilaginibacter paludis]|uniref:Drug resistance transporter, EmrB/QacA subfamily n=1 Tax=Mucilaginibacter paludis DSM 18603 TaxID=714943 RepID=H1Y2Q0_9SPHI|nr:DHA2 family efflux MFS transporter permease subunit [Mucilaginibacter paludis]EHQ28229.1 drug resistance transporter, EmrB/QacA subfamily [Mucilaginibacter paludis DSM 18603]
MSPFNRKLLIITVILAAIMELIDTSIVNVALTYMSGNLGSTLEDTAWVITSYAIANVIIIPMTSFLTNKLGRRNYYIGSVILFILCSLMCGQAHSISELVIFRFLQGLGGGALLSVSAAVVYELFPKEKLGTASALFGIGIFIGPTIGPTLGGYITENYSWPWIFYINVPIGILVAVSCYFLLPESKVKTRVGKVDWLGIGLLTVGISSLQTVLERGQTEDWFATNYIIVLTVTAILSLTGFVICELRVDNPVVDLRVLKSKSLKVAAILTFITGMGMFTSIFLTPVVAQRLLGFTPSQSGLLLLPGAIIAVFALIISGKMLQRGVSPVLIILFGFLCFIYFNWSMSTMSLETPAIDITLRLIFRALGMALLTMPLSSLAVSSLEAKDMPQGTALNNMMRQLGGSFGISIINTYSARRTASHRVDLISNVTASNPLTTDRINGYTAYFQHKGSSMLDAHQKAMKLIDMTIVKQSTLMSYLDSFLLIGLLFALALPLLLFVIKRSKANTANVIVSDH